MPTVAPTEDRQYIVLGTTPPLRQYLRSLWERRSFAFEIARNDFRSQHLDSVLGEVWFLLNPLLLMGVYWLVFGVMLGTDRGVENFVGFLGVGIFTFNLSRRGIMRSAGTMRANQGLIRSLQFPRALIPLSVTFEQLLGYLPQLGVAALVLILTGEPITLAWLVVPLVLVVQTTFTLGAGLFTARLGHHARDLQNALPYFLRLAFYLSGVLFDLEKFVKDPSLRSAFLLNPFFVFVTLMRHYLMESADLPVRLDLLWASASIWTVLALVVGTTFFRGAESEYGRA